MTPRTRALIGINAVAFVWSVGLGAAMPVIPLLSYKFIPDVALAGVVTAIGGVGGVFMGYLSGPLIDRFGTRRISLWGIIIRMVFSFLEGLSRSYVQLAAYRFGSSIGTAIYGTGLSVITAEVSTSRDRGSITGRRSAFAQAGNVLGPLVGAAAWTITNSIRAPFILNGCSKLLCLLIFFFMVREERELPQEEEGAAAQQGALESEWASSEQSTVAPGHLLATIFSTGFFFVVYAIFVESLFRQGITNVVLPVYIRTVLERSTGRIGAHYQRHQSGDGGGLPGRRLHSGPLGDQSRSHTGSGSCDGVAVAHGAERKCQCGDRWAVRHRHGPRSGWRPGLCYRHRPS